MTDAQSASAGGSTKLPKTMRLDQSDEYAFESAAPAGEWAIPGGFEFAGADPDAMTSKQRLAFGQGFLGLGGFGRSTLAVVSTATPAERDEAVAQLARHLIDAYGAPSEEAARQAAELEIAFAEELCEGQAVGRLLMVEREIEDGQIIERFRTAARPDKLDHTKIWTLVPDDENGNDA
ncbi:DUF6505 family protein [Hwanghaeella sp.]|uniref:DUF6505 family protein n=1 Tax=Hwanghaeella sp. TaxID=2605943 RepID=UPI003CCBA688